MGTGTKTLAGPDECAAAFIRENDDGSPRTVAYDGGEW